MPDPPVDVTSALDAYSAAVRAEIAGYLAAGEPDRFLYGPIRASTLGTGKCLRPALCLAACEAFGGSQGDALASAVAVELLHAAFLIHDDIEDGSVRRRGRAALHVELGTALALNAGDALAVLAQRPLLDNVERLGSRMARIVLAEFQVAMERTVEGQAVELGWRHDQVTELTPADYLDMILHKTCAYTTILPLRVGALIGSWGDADLDAIARFGFALGAAFQIRDDVLDLVSAGASYGKNALGDVWEGKRTLALIHLLRLASGDDRDELTAFLARPAGDRAGGDAARIRDLMDHYGSVRFAAEFGARMADEALDAFDGAFSACPPSPARDFLRGVVPFMVERAA
jgi:geranylgeranyl diphosphate synthase, type II